MPRCSKFLAFTFLLAFAFVCQVGALTNNLALTPPMGWNDWNAYGCGISESIVTNNANFIVSSGLKAAGYQYVDIDDCWQISRDANGVIVPDASKFAHGIPWVANYVHSLGLNLGVYTDHGTNTCQGKPGSYGYEYLDAFTYASWGADYLKEDNCKVPIGDDALADYSRMSDGLMKSGRAIMFCLCGNGLNTQSKGYDSWSPVLGNYWRTTGDIGKTFASMISHIDPNSTSAFVAGPGRWNDPDMLQIGNGEFATNFVASQTHFTMWCIMAAPLVMGNNLTTMSNQNLAILTNAETIAVNQDPAGEQGILVGGVKDSAEVWSKPLGYDFTTRAVVLLNRDTNNPATITCNWTNLALQNGAATVRDLVTHQDLGTFTNSFTATVTNYGSVLLKIVGTPNPPPIAGTNYLSDRQPIYSYTGFGTIVPNKSIGGNTLTLGGVAFPKGIGVNSRSGVEYDLGGICSRLQMTIGVDDEVGSSGSVIFEVFADGVQIYNSGAMTGSTASKTIDLDMTGVRRLTLGVDDDNDGTGSDHADWANALVTVTNTTPQMPEIPTGLTASPGNSITLNWNDTLAALTYNVKRATNTGGPYTTITNVPITTFTDNTVGGVTNYFYVVSAVSSFGEGSNSIEASAAPCSVPIAPVNLTTSVSNSQVTVQWNASDGATSYTISRFTGSTPPIVLASGITMTNFTDATESAGTTNYYLINAANACNQSSYSFYAAAIIPPLPPAAPTGLSAAPGNAQVNLSWNISTNATGYNLKRSTTNGGTYTIISSNLNSTSYLDTAVTNGTTYYYVVSALNSGGESTNSTQVAVTPFVPPTAYWTNTVAATAQNWNVNANWTNAATFPNSSGELTVIAANISSAQTINLNQPITIGSLQIGDANASARYIIAANGGSLTMSDTNTLMLTQLASSFGDVLATPVSITTNLIFVNNSANPLILAGNLSSSGGALTIGSGTLEIGSGATNGSLGSVNITNNGSLIFNRSDNVTNSGVISGSGSVAQNGTGILNLSGANTFSGGVTIENGTLQAGNAAALGSTSGNTVITNGGTLDEDAFNLTGESFVVSGAGVGGKGVIVNSGAQQTLALRNVKLAGDTTIGGTGPWNPNSNVNRWDIRAASNSSTNGCSLSTGNHPYKLTKTGGNQISLVAVCVDTNLGDIDIQQGLMGWETATSTMGNPASNIIVRAGATLSFFNANTAWNKHFVLYGNGVSTNMYNWSGANVVIGPVQLNGNCVFWGGGTSLALSNVVSGTGALIKNGAYKLILAGTNNYSGSTIVNGGNLSLTGNGSIFASTNITVNSGATLDASGRGDTTLTLANGQTLAGNGVLNGNVIVGNGATLAPGNSVGVLTFSNNLTLNGGSRTAMELNKSLLTNDVAQVAGTLTYGGTLALTNLSGALASGDHFKLFNAANYSGAFTNISPAIPAVNLAWNTNSLTNGVLSIVTAPTPPPKFNAISEGGNNFIFSGGNGVPNWSYYILASTNPALPLTNWTIISTNSFDANGNFNFTNTADPNASQSFYLLQLR